MEDRVVINDNGREVETADINTLGESGALADDRVLAELFRMSTSGVAKGILPYAEAGSNAKPIIEPTVSARTFTVNPFRAFVGIRADAAGDGKKLWRDIRTVISPTGTTTTRTVSLAANGSGNPRWDLIYAVIVVDNNVSQTRFIKDPLTDAVTSASYVTKQQTTLSIAVAQGTPAGSPTRPAVPADSGSTYNVPLAYVLVVDGATTIQGYSIVDVAPVLALAPSTAASVIRPASFVSDVASGALFSHQTWPLTGTSRPGTWIPPSMTGGVSVYFAARLTATVNIANGDVIDDKIDWRKRLFNWVVQPGSVEDFAGDPAANALNEILPCPVGFPPTFGVGQSFKHGASNLSGGSGIDILMLSDSFGTTGWAGGDKFGVYVDTTTGALKAYIAGSPPARTIFVWLNATAQFPNQGA